jgi:tetratricopeptide (TPR) repeat protein
LKRDPKNGVVRLNLGLAWYKEADFAKASTEFESVYKQAPENRQALYLLADCYLRLGRYREVTQLLEPEYKVHPQDAAIEYAFGTALIQDGQTDRGAVVIDQILKNGNSAEATLLTGASQYASGKYDSAVVTIGKALDMNPSLPGGWTLLGRAWLKAGDNERAKTAFRRALETDPNDFDANIHLGGILRHDGDNSGAEPYLNRALTLRPDSAAARFQVGAVEAATGRLEEARKKLEPLEHEWPDFVEVHLQLASLYARMNRPADSARERQIVLTLNAKARSAGPQPEP